MSGFVQWIAAEADSDYLRKAGLGMPGRGEKEGHSGGESFAKAQEWRNLPTHNFPTQSAGYEERQAESALDRNPDLWLYRGRTTALLRRFMRLSLETGRLPSILGREFFRAKVTSYTSVTFEDRVIFVHDVEGCLERLASFDQEIIARVVLQEHDHERAARLIHCTRKTIERRLPELLDELSEEFLKVRLLVPLPKAEQARTARPV
ncbi:MAG: hypothetical protein WBW38_21680 [Candidatus Sulfotelmatobacter sp.]